jgi:hypothetical protein
MFYISHRGNLDSKNPDTENSIQAIELCLSMGLYVEIDVWSVKDRFFLGHDCPQIQVDSTFLENDKLWCHAKNNEAIFRMIPNKKIHCFWHSTDDYTITSKGFLWAYPGKTINTNTVCVLPELCNYSSSELSNCLGICSDQIIRYINAKNY